MPTGAFPGWRAGGWNRMQALKGWPPPEEESPKRMRRLIRQWLLSPVEWKRHAQQRNARVHALASWVALRRGLLSKLLPRCRELRGVGGVKTG